MQLLLFLLTLMGQSAFITSVLYEYHYISDKMSWNEAQSYCKSNYTDLAAVSSMDDFNRISEFPSFPVNEAAWIGLNRKENATKVWHWSLPGVEFNDSDTKWKSGEGPVNYCGFLFENFEWGDDACEIVQNKDKKFLCYDENNSTKFHLIAEVKSWVEAQKYCRDKHTDLVSGLKQLEDVELKDLVNKTNTATPAGCKYCLWIGLFADRWTWSDGNSSSFRNWELPPTTTERKCAAMDKDSKKSKICDCAELKPFFCYKVYEAPAKETMKLINESLSWEDAFYYCRENHRDLVSITNQVDQVWVQQKARLAQTPFVWIGLRYSCVLDFWFWTSNRLVRYDNWAAGPTDSDCDLSGAMETRGEHKWFKKNMNEKMNFICSLA